MAMTQDFGDAAINSHRFNAWLRAPFVGQHLQVFEHERSVRALRTVANDLDQSISMQRNFHNPCLASARPFGCDDARCMPSIRKGDELTID